MNITVKEIQAWLSDFEQAIAAENKAYLSELDTW